MGLFATPPPSLFYVKVIRFHGRINKKDFSFYVISVADTKVMQKKKKRKVQNDHTAFLQRQQIAHLKKGS